METRVAVLAIIVRGGSSVQPLNELDSPGNVISALSGKIGRLDGITAKTVYAPEGSIGKEENQ